MATHFLKHLVTGEAAFKPEPFYNAAGDCLEFQASDEAVIADRINEVITIYRSAVDERPIGFQIKGIVALLRLLDASEVQVEAESDGDVVSRVTVKVLLVAALKKALSCPSGSRYLKPYAELLRVFNDAA